jgi:hypothetical protein
MYLNTCFSEPSSLTPPRAIPVWRRSPKLRIMRARTARFDRRIQRNFMTSCSPITVQERIDVSIWDVEPVRRSIRPYPHCTADGTSQNDIY